MLLVLAMWTMKTTPATTPVDSQNPPRTLSSPTDHSSWKTYTSEKYRFSIQYPPQFEVEVHEGSTNVEKDFLSLDIGTKEYLAELRTANEGSGSGGLPLFVRMNAATPRTPLTAQEAREFSDCKEGPYLTERIEVNGRVLSKCEYSLMGNFPSLSVAFASDDSTRYVFESHRYSGADKETIEQILSTLKTK